VLLLALLPDMVFLMDSAAPETALEALSSMPDDFFEASSWPPRTLSDAC
jgi:hypothetical protein